MKAMNPGTTGILLLDDDPFMLKLLTVMLAQLGFSHVAAYDSGEKALQRVAETEDPIDLIFLNKQKEVVHLEEHVRPFRISRVSLKASSVLELPPHTIYRSGTQIGDRFEISSLKPRAPESEFKQASASVAD